MWIIRVERDGRTFTERTMEIVGAFGPNRFPGRWSAARVDLPMADDQSATLPRAHLRNDRKTVGSRLTGGCLSAGWLLPTATLLFLVGASCCLDKKERERRKKNCPNKTKSNPA